ncbi:unnamed protein product [Parascedosporium putredinis]|uniref:Uncharacterized protein n=1 Tax=Parascedosporium putredinis TaxID=1442378 RepID=A0A9P1GVF6_9PEZI|nr:unnamed protein product [Parascedosporium putredinis]CAI7988426.1 unnamed protein product [Parascedosporium putredinis]
MSHMVACTNVRHRSMKLIVSGATGFLATEVIRQSLQRPEITSVVAVSRRPITAPQGADPSKLKNLVLKDFNHYSEADKRSLPGPKDASGEYMNWPGTK